MPRDAPGFLTTAKLVPGHGVYMSAALGPPNRTTFSCPPAALTIHICLFVGYWLLSFLFLFFASYRWTSLVAFLHNNPSSYYPLKKQENHSPDIYQDISHQAAKMVSYRFVVFAGMAAALPLNINLGAYSPALVVG